MVDAAQSHISASGKVTTLKAVPEEAATERVTRDGVGESRCHHTAGGDTAGLGGVSQQVTKHLLSTARSQQVTSLKQLKAVLDTRLDAMRPCQRGSTTWQTLSGPCDGHRRVRRPVPNRESLSLTSPWQLSQIVSEGTRGTGGR